MQSSVDSGFGMRSVPHEFELFRETSSWSQAHPDQISWQDSCYCWKVSAVKSSGNWQEEVSRSWLDAVWWIQVYHPQALTISTIYWCRVSFRWADVVSIREEHSSPNRYVALFSLPQRTSGALMSELYEAFKDPDGFLYMTYSAENTLGKWRQA